MTVKELKAILESKDENLEVLVYHEERDSFFDINCVKVDCPEKNIAEALLIN
jgi:hypothetical protein